MPHRYCVPGFQESLLLQESPPAWTQEAHRQPHSKCSLCCSVLGVPHSHLAPGYPSPVLAGGYPVQGYSPQPGLGTPLQPGQDGVNPPPPPRTEPGTLDVDRHPWKQYLPHPSDTGGKKFTTYCNWTHSPCLTLTSRIDFPLRVLLNRLFIRECWNLWIERKYPTVSWRFCREKQPRQVSYKKV